MMSDEFLELVKDDEKLRAVYNKLSEEGRLTEVVKTYSKSDEWEERYLAAKLLKLIPIEKMDDDLKAALLRLMLIWDDDINKAAEEAAKEHDYSSPQEIYDDLSEGRREKVKEEIKIYSQRREWRERYLAAKLLKLIPKKEMTDDLKVIELLLMFDWKEDVSKAAEEAAKALYESLSKEGKVALRKELKEYLMSCVWQDRCLALKVIGCLGLIDFIDRVVELCDDQDLDVKERAFKTLEEFGEGMVSGKIVARKEHLDMLINMFSNRVQYQELLEKLMRLRDELNSTQIDADGAFSGRQQERKRSPKKLKQRDK